MYHKWCEAQLGLFVYQNAFLVKNRICLADIM